MRICEVTEKTPALLERQCRVWEASVRATHRFLSEAEILRIKAYIPQAIASAKYLVIAETEDGAPVGFLGAENGRLEMLFLAPEARGKGLGRQLLEYGMQHFDIRELTVNEQNPQAVEFYRHMGFQTFRRTEHDEEGGPYPLLYMRLR